MDLLLFIIVVNICILSSVRSRLGQGCCGHSWETVLSEDESISWFIKLDELMEDPRTFEMDQESSYFFHNTCINTYGKYFWLKILDFQL